MARQSHQCQTRRAYKNEVEDFVGFTGLRGIAELRGITRAHVLAWRKDLEKRALAPSSIRRKLSALSDYLCEHNAVAGNPADGERQRRLNPALGDAQVRKLLDAPPEDTLKGVRDRAILAHPCILPPESTEKRATRRASSNRPGPSTAAGCGAPESPEQSPDGRRSRRAPASSD
jgi:hypothetical protein